MLAIEFCRVALRYVDFQNNRGDKCTNELMVFLNLFFFINSCDELEFSLPVKAIAQIII